MGLIDRVLDEIDDKAADDIKIGYTFVGVKIGSRIGVAHRVDTSFEQHGTATNLIGTKVTKLMYSDDLLEGAIATAAINAQLNPLSPKKGNISEKILKIAPRYDTIGVVGKFPIINQLKELDCTVYAFEKKSIPGFLPATETEKLLPKCDLVVITGTAFVNKTLERLLELSKGYTMVIGPTTPLSTVLFEFGADVLAGIITDNDNILSIIERGGGTREFKKLVQQLYLEVK